MQICNGWCKPHELCSRCKALVNHGDEIWSLLKELTDNTHYTDEGWRNHVGDKAMKLYQDMEKTCQYIPPTNLVNPHCRICGEAQFQSPSGIVCKNGHGGAPSI